MDHDLEQLLTETRALSERHREVGAALYQACSGVLFPCDGLAMTVLDRSLNLVEGFLLLLPNHGYICSAALLRMQLDNILRLGGVTGSHDPHGVAESVIGGTELRRIKDASGRPMTDQRLLELLEPRNPGVTSIYKQASGYVHLSSEHVLHFLARSARGDDGRRIFRIGNNDDHIEQEHKHALVKAFATVTRGVLALVDLWTDNRTRAGSTEELRRRFTGEV